MSLISSPSTIVSRLIKNLLRFTVAVQYGMDRAKHYVDLMLHKERTGWNDVDGATHVLQLEMLSH